MCGSWWVQIWHLNEHYWAFEESMFIPFKTFASELEQAGCVERVQEHGESAEDQKVDNDALPRCDDDDDDGSSNNKRANELMLPSIMLSSPPIPLTTVPIPPTPSLLQCTLVPLPTLVAALVFPLVCCTQIRHSFYYFSVLYTEMAVDRVVNPPRPSPDSNILLWCR